MAGTYRQLPNGKYELCISLKSDLTGKRIRKYKYVEAVGVREVERKLAEFVAEHEPDNYNESEKMSLSDYADYWIENHAEVNLRERTTDRYKSILPRIKTCLGHKKLCELKPSHLLEFYKILSQDGIREDGKPGKLSTSTIKHHHTLLSSMLSSAVQWQFIKENICDRVKPPSPTQEEKKAKKIAKKSIYTVPQTKQLMAALNDISEDDFKYKVAIYLAIFTGFRRAELMGLEWHDINWEERSITLERSSLYTKEKGVFEDDTKNDGSMRTAYLPKFMMELLKEYKSWWNEEKLKYGSKWITTNRLFTQLNGGAMHPDTITGWFHWFITENKLPAIQFKGLRHLHGSILLSMNMDLESVADQMGHSTTQMLINVYGHNVKKQNKDVANIMEKALLKEKKKTSKSSNTNKLIKVAE